jgi:cytochrome o ubiquinol oxidase subunit 3
MTDATADMFDEGVLALEGGGDEGPAPRDIIVSYGFWIFILSDMVLFSALFASYAVLAGRTAGGPSGAQLFDLRRVFAETACLLLSSFCCGLMSLSIEARRVRGTYIGAALTFALGAAFLALELSEFVGMVAAGDGPSRSAFLSAFFTLVGTHGAHVTCGLIWLTVMMAQVATLGFRDKVVRRLRCFALFWHALDIVWVALFTVVYLIGAR